MEPVTLSTQRLVLRPFALSDVAAVYEACQDPDIQFYTPVPSPYRRSDAQQLINERAPAGWQSDSNYILGAFRSDNDALVGFFCLKLIDKGVYELGYWAAKAQRGQGFALEAARALCDWGFATLDAHRIEWWAMVGNAASRSLAEKLGFTLEGTLRRRNIQAGEPRDWWVGGLLRSEWVQ